MELIPREDVSEGLGEFYEFLWRDTEGFVYLPHFIRSSDEWKKLMFKWPEDRKRIIGYTQQQSALGHDVYVSPALFKTPSPLKDNILGVHTLWVDFDGNAPSSWNDREATSQALTPALGTQGPSDPERPPESQDGPHTPRLGPPSLRIMSSRAGHEHCYWRLSKLETDINYVESINRALAYTLKADTSGWDAGQVLRPPYTTNYKHKLPVSLHASIESQYTRDDFSDFKRVKQLVSESIEIGELPPIQNVIAKYVWDENTLESFMRSSVEEGKRSSSLMALGYFGAEKGMTDEEIYTILIDADDRWGKFKNRSDRKIRMLDIINRARHKHPVAVGSLEFNIRGLMSSEDDVEESPQLVYSFNDFNKLDVQLEWAIKDLLEVNGLGMIVSSPGVGKTQASMQLAMSSALGKPFLVWDIPKPLKILWFSLEMGPSGLQYFTKKMSMEYGQSELRMLNQNLLIVPLGETLPLDKLEGQKFFESLVKEYEPDGIIIDSVGMTTVESLEQDTKAKQLNNYYKKIMSKYQTFIWLVHHNRKASGDNKKPNSLADIHGSVYLQQHLTAAISLWRDKKEDSIELSIIKSRFSNWDGKSFKIKRNENLIFSKQEETIDLSNLVNEVKNDRPPTTGLFGL